MTECYYMIKKISELHSFKGWLFNFLLLGLAVVLLPLLNIWLPEDSVWHVPNYMFPLLGKYLCYALVALAVDLIWGYTGILSLGHGVFFSIGGYAMGMYLMRSIGKEGVYKSDLPDFMVFLDWKELPWYWYGFDNFVFTLLVILVIPGLLAFIFGYFAYNAQVNMDNRGIDFGLRFLGEEASFDIQFSLIEYSGASSYARAYLVGVLNTILVAVIGIF